MFSRGVPSKHHPQWGCFEKDQAEALAAYGHKVVVLSVDARFKRHKGHLGIHHSIYNGVEYYNYVICPGYFFIKILGSEYYRKKIRFHYFDKLYRRVVIAHGKPDILYSQYVFITLSAVQIKEKYSIPLVGIEHFSGFNLPNLSKELEEWGTFAFNRVDKLVSVSQVLADNIERLFAVKSIVVPNMIGREFLCDVPPFRKDGIFHFVAIGSLIKRKGFDILLEAFVKSGLHKQKCRLKIVGEGPERSSLEKYIHKLELEDHVLLLGEKSKEEIVEILSESDVFVLPSRFETFGVVCIESLAMGLPNIATICGGPEEFITSKNGILILPENVDELSSAMQRIRQNFNLYDRASIAGDCRKRFSPEAIAEQLTVVFDETVRTAKNRIR